MKDVSVDTGSEEIQVLTGWSQDGGTSTHENGGHARSGSQFDQQPWNGVKLVASIIAHVGFCVCLALVVLMAVGEDATSNSSHYIVIPAILIACCYVIIVLDTVTSDANAALARVSSQCADDYLNEVKQALPRVSWHVRCYHYTKKAAGSVGSCLAALSGSRQQIVSCRMSESLKFTSCIDMTLTCVELLRTPIIMIESTKVFIIKDEQSQQNYMRQFVEFRESTRLLDDCMEHQEALTIPGFLDHATFLTRGHARPWWLNKTVFWACSLLLFTWPYRWHLNRRSSRAYVVFVKELDVVPKT